MVQAFLGLGKQGCEQMAATYSSFMTTRFYSPVFNTALFDGPIRIYFSQSYESAALKLYHLIQNSDLDLWQRLKDINIRSRSHAFILMYPEIKDLEVVFGEKNQSVCTQLWDEGIAIGCSQPINEPEFENQLESILKSLSSWTGDRLLTDAIA